MLRIAFIYLLFLFTISGFPQKSQKQCVKIIKQSYLPFEMLLEQNQNLKYLEYFMSNKYYDRNNTKKTQSSKVKVYTKASNSLAIMDNIESYRNNSKVVTIDHNRKRITMAQDPYKLMDNKHLTEKFLTNRDTLFSFIESYKYDSTTVGNKAYHKITLSFNSIGQKRRRVRKITWLIDYKSNNFYSMDISYVKGKKNISTYFKIIDFESNSKKTNTLDNDILKQIYVSKGVLSKRYSSYKIIDYTK